MTSTINSKKKRNDFASRSVAWELIPFSTLSQRGLNPIKPVYDPDQSDGRFNLTASTFNPGSVYQQSWSQGLLLRRTRRFILH